MSTIIRIHNNNRGFQEVPSAELSNDNAVSSSPARSSSARTTASEQEAAQAATRTTEASSIRPSSSSLSQNPDDIFAEINLDLDDIVGSNGVVGTPQYSQQIMTEAEELAAAAEMRNRRLIATCFIPLSIFFLLSSDDYNFWGIVVFMSLMNILCASLETAHPDPPGIMAAAELRRQQQLQQDGLNGEDMTFAEDAAAMSIMSFQAQLAAAILESRRVQVLEILGRGDELRPAGDERGVSEEQKKKWEKFVPRRGGGLGGKRTKGYKSIPGVDGEDERGDDNAMGDKDADDPTCSICLCEYERDDVAVKLPCGHIYHDKCVSAWTENHVRCPLCNYNLEEDSQDNDTTSTTTTEPHRPTPT